MVPEADNPRARWRELWKSATVGSIDPLKLIKKALDDYPRNPVLLTYYANSLPSDLKEKAIQVLQEVIKLDQNASSQAIEAAFQPLQGVPASQAEAALAVASNEAPAETQEKTKGLVATLVEKAGEVLVTDGLKILLNGLAMGLGISAGS